MKPEPFSRGDIPGFLALAHGEGWIAEQWELDFLLEAFPEGCLVVRDDGGSAIGFVTSLVHHRSAWIGNLIIAEEHRGKGLGELLFMAAAKALQDADCRTIWLTASKMGMSLYEKHGFMRIDTIQRWAGEGRIGRGTSCVKGSDAVSGAVVSLDALTWGDRRELLLSAVMKRGESLVIKDGFATLQPCGDRFQLGPFVALNELIAADLLASVLHTKLKGATMYLDAPSSNRSALKLFNRNDFRVAGSNELMYFGEKPAYRPELLYGFATMGSCG